MVLTTTEHIDTLLRHTTIEVRLGKQKDSSSLSGYL